MADTFELSVLCQLIPSSSSSESLFLVSVNMIRKTSMGLSGSKEATVLGSGTMKTRSRTVARSVSLGWRSMGRVVDAIDRQTLGNPHSLHQSGTSTGLAATNKWLLISSCQCQLVSRLSHCVDLGLDLYILHLDV
jgi:hypothetical protein